jgi:hypothetical protein
MSCNIIKIYFVQETIDPLQLQIPRNILRQYIPSNPPHRDKRHSLEWMVVRIRIADRTILLHMMPRCVPVARLTHLHEIIEDTPSLTIEIPAAHHPKATKSPDE